MSSASRHDRAVTATASSEEAGDPGPGSRHRGRAWVMVYLINQSITPKVHIRGGTSEGEGIAEWQRRGLSPPTSNHKHAKLRVFQLPRAHTNPSQSATTTPPPPSSH